MNALEMSGAGKRYKGFALENVNLVCRRAAFWV